MLSAEATPLSRLDQQSPGTLVLGDCAMGTMLQAVGLPLGTGSSAWTLERPEAVHAVHGAAVAAGARWLRTNTFGATRGWLAAAGFEGRVRFLNQRAVALAVAARAAAPERVILGSLGPTGERDPQLWHRFYAEQAEALASGGVDGFLVETIVSIEEGTAAVRAARAVAGDAGAGAVWASYTPDLQGDALDGVRAESALERLVAAGAGVAGINCGYGPEAMLPVAARLVRAELAPVLAAPNAGLPQVVEGSAVYSLLTDSFAQAAIQFREVGVRFFAGCCGTTPDHLRAAARALGSPPANPL